MKILLVEDDASKLQIVAAKLKTLSVPVTIETAHNAAQAKGMLKTSQFDVMILDVSLPASADRDADPAGGLSLLRSIVRTPALKKPREIIGLTAYPELKREFDPEFASALWTLVHYDRSSDEWWIQISAKITYLQSSFDIRSSSYGTELCVLTALFEPELKAVLALPWQWEEMRRPDDPSQYWRGGFSRGGERFSVIAASSARMGMPSAATLAMKMIESFRPKFICMTGIAAGVADKCSLGDVVAADPCWDYGSGKVHLRSGEIHFSPSPEQIPLDPFVRSQIRSVSQDSNTLDDIRNQWAGKRVNNVLRLHLGPFASGASVLGDGIVIEQIKQQQRKLIGIDMEAYAIFAAAQESRFPQPLPMVLKGIVDHAGAEKDDSYQSYAAYASAQVLRHLMESDWGHNGLRL